MKTKQTKQTIIYSSPLEVRLEREYPKCFKFYRFCSKYCYDGILFCLDALLSQYYMGTENADVCIAMFLSGYIIDSDEALDALTEWKLKNRVEMGYDLMYDASEYRTDLESIVDTADDIEIVNVACDLIDLGAIRNAMLLLGRLSGKFIGAPKYLQIQAIITELWELDK